MKLPDIRTVEVSGKRVFVRTDLNAPVENGVVANEFRIHKALTTILWLKEQGARVIVASHIGRAPTDTLRPVYNVLSKQIDATFCENLQKETLFACAAALTDGDVMVLENLRSIEGEQNNSDSFAELLASCADLYVNDAFSVSHRAHASIVGVPKRLPHYAGLLFLEEVEQLSKALKPTHPALAILAGAKFETKLPLVNKVLPDYDHVAIGGALATDFYKAQGLEVGDSLISGDRCGIMDLLGDEKIFLPPDVIVKRGEEAVTLKADEVQPGDIIADAGPETVKLLSKTIRDASFILWNGPFGKFEDGFSEATDAVARAVAESDATSIVGGGDSIAAIEAAGLRDSFTFVSTGGGAMIQFISLGTLPGIEALLHP